MASFYEEEIMRQFYQKSRRHSVNATAGKPAMKNVNAPIPECAKSEDNEVRLHRIVSGIYEIHLPRRGRLGDLAVLGEDGNPINPGPREFGPKADVAIAHFKRISAAFDRMNGYGR